jgi:hypothetical protein
MSLPLLSSGHARRFNASAWQNHFNIAALHESGSGPLRRFVQRRDMSGVEVKADSKSMASFRSLLTYLCDSEIRLVGRTPHHWILLVFRERANSSLNE